MYIYTVDIMHRKKRIVYISWKRINIQPVSNGMKIHTGSNEERSAGWGASDATPGALNATGDQYGRWNAQL